MLLLLIAFSLGPLLIFNLWVYQVSRSYWVDMARRDVRHVAKMEVARTLQAVLDRKHRLETVAAGDRKLLESIESFQKAPREAGARALAELGDHLQFIIGQAPAMEALTLIAPTGDVIVRSRPGLEGLGRDARCLSGPLDQVRVLGLEATGSIPTLIVAAPLLDTGGRRLAVLCGRFLFDTHESFVAAHDEISDDSALFLLDEERRVICGSGPPHLPSDHPESLEGRPEGLLERTTGSVERYSLRPSGVEVIGAFEPIVPLGWGLLVEVPTRSVLARIDQLRRRALTLGSIFAMLLVLSIFLVTRTISGRISRVARAATRIAGGTLGERIEEDGPAEVQELASAFNKMSTALRDSQQSLEDRIVERTRDLHESRELSELLLDSLEQRVIVVSLGGEIVKVNRAARRRYGDDLVGRRHSKVFPIHLETGRSAVSETILSGVHQSQEYSESMGDGQEIVRWDTYPVQGALGMTLVIAIGRSITEEKHQQAQMLHQEKMASFGLLAAGVAHEIGNPLAAIESQLRMVRNAREPEGIERTFDVVEAELKRMGRLLRDLVDFGRRRRDRVELISINQVIRDVARLLGHDPRSRRAQIELDLQEDLPGFRGREPEAP